MVGSDLIHEIAFWLFLHMCSEMWLEIPLKSRFNHDFTIGLRSCCIKWRAKIWNGMLLLCMCSANMSQRTLNIISGQPAELSEAGSTRTYCFRVRVGKCVIRNKWQSYDRKAVITYVQSSICLLLFWPGPSPINNTQSHNTCKRNAGATHDAFCTAFQNVFLVLYLLHAIHNCLQAHNAEINKNMHNFFITKIKTIV